MNKGDQYNTEKGTLKEQAKKHIVVDGWSSRTTAKHIGISEKSISTWLKAGQWQSKSKQEQKKLRKKAKYLVVMKGLRQKEVAQIIGISEKTMSGWAKEGQWKEDIKKNLKPENSIKDFIAKFFLYLFMREPDIKETVKKHWYEFIKEEEKEIEIE